MEAQHLPSIVQYELTAELALNICSQRRQGQEASCRHSRSLGSAGAWGPPASGSCCTPTCLIDQLGASLPGGVQERRALGLAPWE